MVIARSSSRSRGVSGVSPSTRRAVDATVAVLAIPSSSPAFRLPPKYLIPVFRLPVAFYVPNLIGYFRLASFGSALYFATRPGYSGLFFWLYFLSYALDAVDGPAARYLKQESRFGAVLDMVVDRVCTAALLALLACDYARAGSHGAASGALALLVLDVGAHWVQSAATGALQAASHKALPNEPALLSWYYKRVNLFLVCLGSETHLAVIFLLARATAERQPLAALATKVVSGTTPLSLAASLLTIPIVNIFLPALTLGDASLAAWLALFTLPIFALKQIISLVQLTRATQRVLEIDECERREREIKH